jgi:hypothetical protein
MKMIGIDGGAYYESGIRELHVNFGLKIHKSLDAGNDR